MLRHKDIMTAKVNKKYYLCKLQYFNVKVLIVDFEPQIKALELVFVVEIGINTAFSKKSLKNKL